MLQLDPLLRGPHDIAQGHLYGYGTELVFSRYRLTGTAPGSQQASTFLYLAHAEPSQGSVNLDSLSVVGLDWSEG